jgi:uncharacterized membrane protein YhhN
MRATPLTLAAIALSAALALTYGAVARDLAAAGVGHPALAALKASSIVVLAGLAFAHRARLLAAALLFGATGDALLALDTQTSFLAGAGAFLIGHVCYIALFVRSGAGVRTLAQPPRLFGVLAMIAAAIAGTLWLVPSGAPLFAPLALYTGVLTAMAISTFTLPPSRWLVMAGGVLFFVSDGFVAHNMFHAADDPTLAFALSFAGWMIYWAGQAALCAGALTLRPHPRENG